MSAAIPPPGVGAPPAAGPVGPGGPGAIATGAADPQALAAAVLETLAQNPQAAALVLQELTNVATQGQQAAASQQLYGGPTGI
jgi:hypothetical protein